MTMYEKLVEISNETMSYEIPIQKGAVWSLRSAPHAIISGISSFGKSFFVFYIILIAAIKGYILYCADPKRSDLASLSDYMPSSRVAWMPEQICEMAATVVEIMEKRYAYMNIERQRRGLFQADFVDFELPVILLVIEEMATFVSSLDKKTRDTFESNIKRITLEGRQAGVMICSVMQNPGTQNISTESRSQMSFRVFLGNSGGIEYRMIFGEGYTYHKRVYKAGQGLYMLAGKTDKPEMIETPVLDKSQLPDALKRALEKQFQINPSPPDPLRSEA